MKDRNLVIDSGSISPSDLLSIYSLGVAIRLPSLWSDSGFATRSLAGSELCTAFDLPSWSIPKHLSPIRYKLFFSVLQPIKALLAVADVLLPFVASRGHHLGSSALQVLPDISIDPRGSWISQPYWMQIKKENSLQRVNTLFTAGIGWLPLSWIDSSLVTDKAVKTDKASVPVHLWDQRICLPMGITKPKRFASIVVIRNLFYKIYRKRLIASFCRYMMATYNQHWIYWLSQLPNLKQYFWLVRGQLMLLRGVLGGICLILLKPPELQSRFLKLQSRFLDPEKERHLQSRMSVPPRQEERLTTTTISLKRVLSGMSPT